MASSIIASVNVDDGIAILISTESFICEFSLEVAMTLILPLIEFIVNSPFSLIHLEHLYIIIVCEVLDNKI